MQTALKEGEASTKVVREFKGDEVVQTMEVIGTGVTCVQVSHLICRRNRTYTKRNFYFRRSKESLKPGAIYATLGPTRSF